MSFTDTKTSLKPFILLIFLILSPSTFSDHSQALEDRTVNGTIFLIVDGLGAYYIYPELAPHSLDGSTLGEANFNLTGWTRVLWVRVPQPKTSQGHSIIVTGSSKATPRTLETEETIFDATHAAGYLNIAVMETGDFESIRHEQDIILYVQNNSLENPGLKIEEKENLTQAAREAKLIMETQASRISSYLDNKKGWERYAAYNQWAIDTATLIASQLAQDNQKFFLTVNIGGLDAAAHHLDSTAYIKVLKNLSLNRLQETANTHNLLFMVTADHGMSFKTLESRGAHANPPYSNTPEARYIPLLLYGPGIQTQIITGNFSQQDIAPTLLSLLKIPDTLTAEDGKPITLQPDNEKHPKKQRKPAATTLTPNREITGAIIIILINSLALAIIWKIWKK